MRLTTEMIYKVALTLKIKWSWSSTVDPGKKGLPVAISKNIHPTPLKRRQREIVNWVSLIIWDCFGWLCFLTGLENSRHLLNQSDTKLKNKRGMVIRDFPRFKQLACLSSHWLMILVTLNLVFRRWIETVWTQSRPRLFFELQQLTIHLEFWDFNDSSMLLYRQLSFTVSISLFKIRFNVLKRVLWKESTAFLL